VSNIQYGGDLKYSQLLSLFFESGRSNISSKYTITESSNAPSSHAGLWKIQRGVRATGGALASITAASGLGQSSTDADATGEASAAATNSNGSSANNERSVVSVWSHSLNARARERTLIIDVLKKEVRIVTNRD
jgi:hypothetical protein